MPDEVLFRSLRSDWYRGNGVVPRLLRDCLTGRRDVRFAGFPRQWLALFAWYGVKWRGSSTPREYIPVFSELTERQVVSLISAARDQRALRRLAEVASTCDPVLADCLYIVDNTTPLTGTWARADGEDVAGDAAVGKKRCLVLNGWQSYGRPCVRRLEEKVARVRATRARALVLPCSRRRPYETSRTHRRILAALRERGYDTTRYQKVVVTALGVLPEEVWSEPEVLNYDAGVPDVYRTLRLVREFFGRRTYQCVVDCGQFEPYSDVLRIAAREGVITRLERVRVGRSRQFVVTGERLRGSGAQQRRKDLADVGATRKEG